MLLLPVLFFIFNHVNQGQCLNGRGLTPLDSASFRKITSKFNATLIKFDTYFPFGPAHDEYVKLAGDVIHNNDFLVAEIGYKDYGDFENQDMLDRFKVSKEDLPAIKLYFPDGRPPVPFAGPVTADALRRFLRAAGVPLPLPGALAAFDRLAKRLAAAPDAAEQARLQAQAAALLETTPAEERDTARYYVRVMSAAAQDGAFVEAERRRLQGLLEGKLSDQKRRLMETRLNVLQAFVPRPDGERDEL